MQEGNAGYIQEQKNTYVSVHNTHAGEIYISLSAAAVLIVE
jgi:hypothetical protein